MSVDVPRGDDTEAGRVLEQRARELARVPQAGSQERAAFVDFRAGGQRYHVPLASVREIVPAAAIARLPGAAPGLLGVTNVRGALLPVFTIQTAASQADTSAWFLVLDGDGDPLALAVDEISSVAELRPVDVRETSRGRESDVGLVGVTTDGAAIIDVDHLVRDERFASVMNRPPEHRP